MSALADHGFVALAFTAALGVYRAVQRRLQERRAREQEEQDERSREHLRLEGEAAVAGLVEVVREHSATNQELRLVNADLRRFVEAQRSHIEELERRGKGGGGENGSGHG